MPEPVVTVVVPTLVAGPVLADCIKSLERQTRPDIEVIIVDNGGRGQARASVGERDRVMFIENEANLGFGAAVNQALGRSRSPYVAVLNDDAEAHPQWIESLVAAIESDPRAGMCASQVRLAEGGRLDSAGMLLCGDGSSKQRGCGAPPEEFDQPAEVLCPSGAAALYRRAMLEETGGFDESFFLYCEDTDLGLRARRAGWNCLYVPAAVADHRYSQSAGAASALKAYLVERNRLFLVLKNFPLSMLPAVPFYALARYFWHFVLALRGHGAAARFHQEGNSILRLAWFLVRSHAAALKRLPRLVAERRRVRRAARLGPGEFRRLLRAHSISPREVAAL